MAGKQKRRKKGEKRRKEGDKKESEEREEKKERHKRAEEIERCEKKCQETNISLNATVVIIAHKKMFSGTCE